MTSGAELSVHFPASGCCPGGPPEGWLPGEGLCADGWGGGSGECDVRGPARSGAGGPRVRVPCLGSSHPCGSLAVLLASELVTNSLRYGGSAGPGEAVTFTVTVVVGDAGVRVEVTGRKADGVPVLRPPDDEAEGGRGLRLVEDLAVRWGYDRGGGQATTWFELPG